MEIYCHILGCNDNQKKELKEKLNYQKFEVIDLDKINSDIISDNEIHLLYQKYSKFKAEKNEKYKDIENKMTKFWENNFKNILENSITNKKTKIVIGNNYHYKNINKRIPIDCIHKFVLIPCKNDIRNVIKNNLKIYENEIINGFYPISNLDFNFLYNQKKKIYENYIKINYLPYEFKKLKNQIEMINSNKLANVLYITLDDPYNVNTFIHPKENLKGYDEVLHSILNSIDFDSSNFEKVIEKNSIKLVQKKYTNGNIDKNLDVTRFIYKVDGKNFLPSIQKNNIEYISYIPVKILDKKEINVREFINNFLN